jgi:hypothetical protein
MEANDLLSSQQSQLNELLIKNKELFVTKESPKLGLTNLVDRYSFFLRTIITWNTIPQTLRQVNTIDQFQAGLGPITLPVLSQM